MLFNSYEFIFLFLPVTVAGFLLLERIGRRQGAIIWLLAASLFFYGWWNPIYVPLILFSIAVNYLVGNRLSGHTLGPKAAKRLVTFGVAFNLALLGYFKYANFFVANWQAVTDEHFAWAPVILPIAISFHTFQQIAYLVDAYRGEAPRYPFLHYGLFVTFFPQMIAGPIVHHREMLPQFLRRPSRLFQPSDFAVGLTIFAIGLFKKSVIADGLAVFASPVFAGAHAGASLGAIEAWGAALAYTGQLYFDFSGYSDMAIGLGRLFGVRLPANFNSPYQSASIIEFWRRWHMTLSRFLRDYLYIPLGGSRKGTGRRYQNLMITMLLGGFWHGAGWTYVIWGGLHGLYLVINHAWRFVRVRAGFGAAPTVLGRICGWAITFVAVVVAWVVFRADSLSAALTMLHAMTGANGALGPESQPGQIDAFDAAFSTLGLPVYVGPYLRGAREGLGIAAALLLAWLAPNTQAILRRYRPAFRVGHDPAFEDGAPVSPILPTLQWRGSPSWALAAAAVATVAVLAVRGGGEFIYFQF